MSNCYLCGNDGDHPLDLPSTFTSHSLAKCPSSSTLCDRCYQVITGNEKQLFYWNENKKPPSWSKVWGRSLSRLYAGRELISPIIDGERDGLRVVHSLPTRTEICQWLLNPPQPPFTIIISTSGQKHILPFAQEGYSRDLFPIQFELLSVEVDRLKFAKLLERFESIYSYGFTKIEILEGNYSVGKSLGIDYGYFRELDEAIAPYRKTALLELAAFVGQKNVNKDIATMLRL